MDAWLYAIAHSCRGRVCCAARCRSRCAQIGSRGRYSYLPSLGDAGIMRSRYALILRGLKLAGIFVRSTPPIAQ